MGSATYRSDIDGLRAVAVLAVVAFHVVERNMQSGFLGVDIFFVISGYLITRLVTAEINAGNFSFARFYARRIRRIYPALIVVIIATLAGGAALMLPNDFAATAASARAAALGISNFYFWSVEGYFSSGAWRRPLLHTWSLGVEEQFYLVWPLLLLVGYALRRWLPRWTLAAVIVLVSLAWSWTISTGSPYELFYSPLTRAWELGLGALVAEFPAFRRRSTAEGATVVGIGLIAASLLWGATLGIGGQVMACAGAALIVWEKDQRSWSGLALGSLPLRAIGVISYSVYLWHWPILVLTRKYFRFGADMSGLDYALCVIAILAVGTLSWAVIERPFRRWRAPSWQPLAAGAAAAAVVLAGATFIATDGLASRFDPKVLAYLAVAPAGDDEAGLCFLSSRNPSIDKFDLARCLRQDPNRPNVLVIGDSHADEFVGALRRAFPEIAFSQVSASGCLMMLHDRGDAHCVRLADRLYGTWLKSYRFDAAILSARWSSRSTSAPVAKTMEVLRADGIVPIVLGPSQEYAEDLPSILAYSLVRGVDLAPRNERISGIRKADKRLADDLGTPAGSYFSILAVSCPLDHCRTLTPDGEPMLHDSNHLSEAGARYVLDRLRQQGLLADLVARARNDTVQKLRVAG